MTTALTTLPTVFGEATASQVLALAQERAVILADVIKKQHLYVTISGRDHVLVEGWTFLGSMVGLFPTVVWSRPVLAADGAILGAEARVEVISASGDVRGSAEACCLYAESKWANRDFYALRSMAQTRATSKALRLPLGFVMVLAGYEATPAEEMPDDDSEHPRSAPSTRRPVAPGRTPWQPKQPPKPAAQTDERGDVVEGTAREVPPEATRKAAAPPVAPTTPVGRSTMVEAAVGMGATVEQPEGEVPLADQLKALLALHGLTPRWYAAQGYKLPLSREDAEAAITTLSEPTFGLV